MQSHQSKKSDPARRFSLPENATLKTPTEKSVQAKKGFGLLTGQISSPKNPFKAAQAKLGIPHQNPSQDIEAQSSVAHSLHASPIQVQREASDFQVSRLPAGHERRRSRIFFMVGQDTIPPEEAHKITDFVRDELARQGSHDLELVGMSSEEGPSGLNQNLARNRAQNVRAALISAGYPGPISIRSITGEQANRADYAQMRSVELLRPGATSVAGNVNRTVDCATLHPASYPARFMALLSSAQDMVSTAASDLQGARSSDTNDLLNKYFADDSDATAQSLHDRLMDTNGIHDQLDIYRNASNHECREACTGSVASNSGRGRGAGAKLNICPILFSTSRPEREILRTLIHESAHGSPAIVGLDIGYRYTRMIPEITTTLGLKNPDSIALFVQEMNGLSPLNFGRRSPDNYSGFSSNADQREVETALAFIELYVMRVGQIVASTYSQYRRAQNRGRSFTSQFLDSLGNHFGFPSDRILRGESVTRKIAAVKDRLDRMRFTMTSNRRALNLTHTVGTTTWSTDTNSAGRDVEVGQDFAAQSGNPVPQLKVLLGALVRATPDISASLVNQYVEMIDELRRLNNFPDPQLR